MSLDRGERTSWWPDIAGPGEPPSQGMADVVVVRGDALPGVGRGRR